MSEQTGNVIELNLTPVLAKKILLEILEDSGKVFFSAHAEERMEERKITRSQVLRCLRHGRIIEGPAKSIKGNWEMTIESMSAGDVLTVVIALENHGNGNYSIIITAY